MSELLHTSESISVVMPCYNGSAFLREAIDSALGQSHRPLEIIVVDDGSTDDSAAIAESYGSPVRVIHQENRGESAARNRAIEECRGDWIAFLDADDVWLPAKLECQLAETEPDVVCLHSRYYNFGARTGESRRFNDTEAERYKLTAFVSNHPCCMSSLVVRRSVRARFPEWTTWGEDRLYLMDVVSEGRIKLVDRVLLGNRRHDRSQTSNTRTEVERHRSLVEWLRRRPGLSPKDREAVLHAATGKLVDRALGAKRKGDRERYEVIREYLSQSGNENRLSAAKWRRIYGKLGRIFRSLSSPVHS